MSDPFELLLGHCRTADCTNGELAQLLKEKPLEECLRSLYHQELVKNTLEKSGSIHKFTYDIISDNYSFSPVAYSFSQLDGSSCQVVVERLIEADKNSEISKWIGFPNLGRQAKLVDKGKTVGRLLEVISLHPVNRQPILQYIHEHLLLNLTSQQKIEDVLKHIKSALEIDASTILASLLPNIPPQVWEKVEPLIRGVEHIAFTVFPDTSVADLDALALKAGFPAHHQTFPSTIAAEELGVPTQIFKAWGMNQRKEKIGVEIFIPHAENKTVRKWISEGMEVHVAIRVKDPAAIVEIQKLLTAHHLSLPEFMHNQPMKNEKEGSLTLYFDTKLNNHSYRIEFYFKK